MLTAITRAVSPSLGDCELTRLPREPIDIVRAVAQHDACGRALAESGAPVIDEVAVITARGIASRRGERDSMAAVRFLYAESAISSSAFFRFRLAADILAETDLNASHT